MNNFLIPFNHQPANTTFGNTGAPYTCPAGKYARVTATLSVAQANASYGLDTGSAYGVGNGTGQVAVISVWIKSGDAVAVTAGSTPGQADLTINGNQVGVIECTGSNAPSVTSSNNSVVEHANFFVEEYNELT